MVLIKGKKGQVEYLIEIVLAAFLIGLTIIVIYLLVIYGFVFSFSVDATVDDYSASAVCDTYLLNFLRYEDAETGLTFAEIAVLAEKDSKYRDKFSAKATQFFDNNYQRGNFQKQEWALDLITTEKISIVSAGKSIAFDPLDTCSQNIPSQTPGKFITAKLTLEY